MNYPSRNPYIGQREDWLKHAEINYRLLFQVPPDESVTFAELDRLKTGYFGTQLAFAAADNQPIKLSAYGWYLSVEHHVPDAIIQQLMDRAHHYATRYQAVQQAKSGDKWNWAVIREWWNEESAIRTEMDELIHGYYASRHGEQHLPTTRQMNLF